MTKQVTIFLSRKITVNRPNQEPLSLEPGRNTVDADVAEIPFVKAHIVGDAPDASAELDELRTRVAELTAAHAERVQERDNANDALVTLSKASSEQAAALATAIADRDAALARAATAEQALEQKSADMQALIDSIPAPAAPAEKPAKGKA